MFNKRLSHLAAESGFDYDCFVTILTHPLFLAMFEIRTQKQRIWVCPNEIAIGWGWGC